MSGAGVNPLAIYDPATYASQLAIQRRQALAQSLLQQGEQDPGHAAYGGLRNAGNAILGAFLAKRADKQLGDLYNPQAQAAPQAQTSADPGQLSNEAGTGPNLAPVSTGSNPNLQASPPRMQPQGQTGQSGTNPPDYATLPPQAQHIYDQLPKVPGASARETVNAALLGGEGWAEFLKAHYAAIAQTPEMKNAAFAMPGDTAGQQQAIGGVLNKAGTITGRAGNILIGPNGQTNYVPPQAPAGYRYIQGQNNQPILVPIQGGADAIAGAAQSQAYGKARATGGVGFDGSGMPTGTDNATLYNLPAPPGMGGQQPPSALPASPAVPGQGASPAPFNANIGQSIVKALFPGAAITSGQRSQQRNSQVGGVPDSMHLDGNAVDFVLPPGRSFAEVQQAFAQSGLPASELINEGSHVHWGWGAKPQGVPANAPGGLVPQLPASQQPYMAGQGKDASDRHDQTIAEAQDAPDRINVLDNILNLSQAGVATGPGQEWQNHILGTLSNLPGLAPLMGKAQGNVAKFQELQKFLLQNGQRAWQAAGGTGTDAQLNAASHANPNDAQFPQALQTITKWVKAGELAVQAKANAQDSFLQSHGNTAQNQIAFENNWRNALDRRVFQLQTMAPQEQQTFIKSLSPADAKTLIQKRQALRSLGAIQ